MSYSEDRLEEGEVESLEAVVASSLSVRWLNLDGLHDVSILREIGERFDLHRLLLEDVISVGQRPKFEEYDGRLFVVLHMLSVDDVEAQIREEQVSMVLSGGTLLTFQERTGDVFEPVRRRLREASGRIRARGADYLMYALIDAVVDGYFGVLERLGNAAERLDGEIADDPTPDTARRLHALKREALVARRSIWPVRELASGLLRSESELITADTRIYLRDVYDHAVQAIDAAETLRELTTSLMDLYLSTVGQRTNEVMRVLTVIASLFIPLTFLAGLYGMNFQYMPELAFRWAYPVLLGVMGVLAVGMLQYFKRKGWL
jgi:magnesium transporter